ncbi:hypothetical protein SMD_3395 [Stenotrophomonas maltophilia D457]|nr:hypothetical protein SMD_3395 [Stenotrophomonas maltophilia D457]
MRRTVAGGVYRQGCALHLQRPRPRQEPKQQQKRVPVGRRGGSGCGRRRKPIHGGLAAASMPRTLPQPDPPRLRQFPAVCWNGFGVRSVFRRKTDLTPDVFRYLTAFIHAWRGSTVSTKVDTYQQPRRSVRGGAVSECGVSAAWMRLPSLQGRTCSVPALRHRPANPRNAASAVAVAVA